MCLATIFKPAALTPTLRRTIQAISIPSGLIGITARVCETVLDYPAHCLGRIPLSNLKNTPRQPKLRESHSKRDWLERDIEADLKFILFMAILILADRALVVAIAHPLSQRWGLF